MHLNTGSALELRGKPLKDSQEIKFKEKQAVYTWRIQEVCNHHLALNNSVNTILRKIPHLIELNFHAYTDNKIFSSHETRSLYFPTICFFFLLLLEYQ